MKKNYLKKYFPIETQTSDNDKQIILNILKIFEKKKISFNYLEIGSFLGGSLTPFLMNNHCKLVCSVDKRNQFQDDERNKLWSYENISEVDMINNLQKQRLNLSKLKTFNGDVKNFVTQKKFELVFIDGIHTDINTFSDFLYSLSKATKDCIILFHDVSIIFKSLKIIQIYLENKGFKFKFNKFKDSEIAGIFFGKFTKLNLNKKGLNTENFERFCLKANDKLLIEQFNNRVKINFKISRFIKKKYPYKISLRKKTKMKISNI